ncbi:SDR family oxidoreductase [Novosphingobium sp. JCM 18896]|uniref:SDR family oxidoreductase n=1 Tax=Novosphingobium sp. JCM 18896 TaxID=2989731 RepID=UPI002223218C|nr:aldehyde reductase [Novosphingobium sp. JCM 18896]MCW1431071.1 aldehyde reductase [Novosphingobium sp. JCM 18896]
MTKVLVTGGTGFIAQHCIVALLNAGYDVKTTLRSLKRKDEVIASLRAGGVEPGARLEFAVADLMADDGWAEAAADCEYAFHGASPTPAGDQVAEDDWVRPAVEGNLRLLRAARDAGMKRVVLTSAFGAVGAGHRKSIGRPFVETDWSDLDGLIAPYQKSKTLAELASWEFIAREGRGLELASINPTMVLGPALGDYSHSIRTIKQMLDGQPGCPKINTCIVDVRDVADLHLLAMTDPKAAGERFLATSGHSMWMVDIARLLKDRLGPVANKVSTRELPNLLVRTIAMANPSMKGIVPLLGVRLDASGEKAQQMLGWSPRSPEDAILASAESLVRLGVIGGGST